MVPVLSNTTVLILWAVSKACPDLIRIPCSAPLPVPTIIATGVASPNAQGQEITNTLMAQFSANSKVAPDNIQIAAVMREMPITIGTNTPAMRSASLAIGAFVAEASSTRRIICAKVVSLPTLLAVKRINPPLFIVAPMTESPGSFSTGILSPVMADWSILVWPSVMIPSTGMRCPGFTSTVSPIITCSTGTSNCVPLRSMVAVFGAISIKWVSASLVLPFERVSKYLPMVISARIITEDSK